jgi:hypothetical protein
MKSLFAKLLVIVGLALVTNTTASAKEGRWSAMDYGTYFTASIEAPQPKNSGAGANIAQKGMLIRLDDKTNVCFDKDLLRYSAGWTGGLIDWRSIVYDGSHGTWPKIAGAQLFGNPLAPGWADGEGSFADNRLKGKDGRRFGPLDHKHARWRGLYVHGKQVVLSYSVGDAIVMEQPGLVSGLGAPVFSRTLNIAKSSGDLELQIIERPAGKLHFLDASGQPGKSAGSIGNTIAIGESATEGDLMLARVVGSKGVEWDDSDEKQLRLSVPASATPCRLKVVYGRVAANKAAEFHAAASKSAPADLTSLTKGGPARFTETLTTKGKLGGDDAPFATDTITWPADNPWKSWMRLGGFDFFKDPSRAAVGTWNGDVWIVEGLDDDLDELRWKRIATGLFQPLGVKVVNEQIYICCRDEITRLHDLNNDGEADYLESFNNDHQVTEHFHEFAMDLQTDADGSFYYAKSARHALDSLVPHHGTLIKVAKDGKTSEIVCNGFRAANGVGIGPDGLVSTSDQEGHWTPANRINLCRPGGFYGNMYTYHRGERPTTYDRPVVWLPKNYDRSPAEQLWVSSDKWAPLKGNLLSFSYGTGMVRYVMYEKAGGLYQGASVDLPLRDFPTGIMRGRFHPKDGQLYLCGLFGWSSNKSQPGGFYRVRYTDKPLYTPVNMHVTKDGVELTFTDALDKDSVEDIDNYVVQRWNYRWTRGYGSKHYSVKDPKRTGQDEVEVLDARLLADGVTVSLELDDMKPVQQMMIEFGVKAADGTSFKRKIMATINAVGDQVIGN